MKRSKYKLYNNDCLKQMQTLADEGVKVDLVLTDPPYGVSTCKWDTVIPFEQMWEKVYDLSNPTTPTVLFGTEPFSTKLRMSNMENYKYDWIWKKPFSASIGIANYQPMRYHELISVFYKKAGQYYKQMIRRYSSRIKQGHKNNYQFRAGYNELIMAGGKNVIINASRYDPDWKNPSSVLEFNPVQSNSAEKVPHSSQKPVDLLEYLIKTYTHEGDVVLDFTMGSGSTGVACMNTDRDFIGIEIDKTYFDIAKKRISDANKQTRLI